MSGPEIKDNGKTIRFSSKLAFWVYDYNSEEGDSLEDKNTFKVDSVNMPSIKFDDIPILIEWLSSLKERFSK